MTFRTETTLAGYARAAVDLKTRMAEYCSTVAATEYLRAFVDSLRPADRDTGVGEGADPDKLVDVIARATAAVWPQGQPYVLAPAMTAVVAAAAEALDLTGERLTDDVAPCDGGVLFLPEPIYHRNLAGRLSGIAAITWTPMSNNTSRFWLICG